MTNSSIYFPISAIFYWRSATAMNSELSNCSYRVRATNLFRINRVGDGAGAVADADAAAVDVVADVVAAVADVVADVADVAPAD